jgi:Arc/MetJ-type ribon-helix-helix transcriptional regulator
LKEGKKHCPAMTVTIPNELEPFVQAKLKAGGFDSPEAVVAAALAAWQGEDVLHSMDRTEVERLLLAAIDSPRVPWSETSVDQIVEGLRSKNSAP